MQNTIPRAVLLNLHPRVRDIGKIEGTRVGLQAASMCIARDFTNPTLIADFNRGRGVALANHIFSDDMGLKIMKAAPGFIEAELKIEEKHRNGYDLKICHGGVLATACDTVMALAKETLCTPAEIAVNASMYTQFFEPASVGDTLTFKAATVDPNDDPKNASELLVTITNQNGLNIGYAKGVVVKKKRPFAVN